MKLQYLAILIIIIVVAIGIYFTKTTNFMDFISGANSQEIDNDFGGKTLKKSGGNISKVSEYPEDFLPIIDYGEINSYELVMDKDRKVIEAFVSITSATKSYEELIKYYTEFYSKFNEYTGKERPKLFEGDTSKEYKIECTTQVLKKIKVQISGPDALNKDKYTVEMSYGK